MQNLRVAIALGSVDASGPDERAVFFPSVACKIKRAYLVDTAAKTGSATDYGTYSLINKGTAGSGTTVVATRATDTPTTDNITAFVAWPLTMQGDSAQEIAAGAVVTFKAEETGTADSGDLAEALLVIEFDLGG